MKRPNGYGSIYKLHGKRRKPWNVIVTISYQIEGEEKVQVRKSLGTFARRYEAEDRLVSYNKGYINIDKIDTTFKELKEMWSKTHYKNISKSSIEGYEAAYLSFSPLHEKLFSEIRLNELQEIIDKSAKSYSAKAQRKSFINQLYKYALQDDIVHKNYAEGIVIGSNTGSDLHKPFTEKEIRMLFKNIDIPFIDVVLIQIHTGARSIDLTNNIEYYLDKGYIITGSKTEAGRDRIIPLHENIIDFVQKRYNKYGRLFKEENMTTDMFRYRFKRALSELGLKKLPHDSRHTFISIMDNTEANKVAIQRIVGHSSSDVTSKVYTHKDVYDLKEAIAFFPDFRNKSK